MVFLSGVSRTLLEQVLERGTRIGRPGGLSGRRIGPGCEPFAAVGAIAVPDTLRAALAAFVVGGGIVVRAVATDVEVGATRARVAEPHAFVAPERLLATAREAVHGRTVAVPRAVSTTGGARDA
jgi:hypothetical protein